MKIWASSVMHDGADQAPRHPGPRGGQADLRPRDDQAPRPADENRGRRDLGTGRGAVRLVGPPRVLGRPADHPRRVRPAEAADPGRHDPGRGSRRSPDKGGDVTRGSRRAEDAGRRPEIASGQADTASSSRSELPDEDRKAIAELAAKLSEEHKWLTPRELEKAQVAIERPAAPVRRVVRRPSTTASAGRRERGGVERLTEVEKRAVEVGSRLVHYQAIRDREIAFGRADAGHAPAEQPGVPRLLGRTRSRKAARSRAPRPHAARARRRRTPSTTYWNDIPLDEREMPGTDAKFDERFTAWLRTTSAWVPLKVLLDAKPEELAEAGFPARQGRGVPRGVQGARAGRVGRGRARWPRPRRSRCCAASRELGEAVNPGMYPDRRGRSSGRPTSTQTNPFCKAPVAYGAGDGAAGRQPRVPRDRRALGPLVGRPVGSTRWG